MSAEKPHVTTVELIFRERDGQIINPPLIFFEGSAPIPLVGEEVIFTGDCFKVLSRQFSYRILDEKRSTYIRVVLICETFEPPVGQPQFIPHIPHRE